MPVSHIGLTVYDLPSACTFYLSALRPLGYRIVREEPYQVALGTGDEAELFLCQDPSYGRPTGTHLAFAASSPSEVDLFFDAALRAGASSHVIPGYRGQGLDEYSATVIDNGSNAVEVSYCDPAAATASRKGPDSVPSERGFLERLPLSQIIDKVTNANGANDTLSTREPEPARTQNGPSSTLLGALMGAAAGAAVAYALVKDDSKDWKGSRETKGSKEAKESKERKESNGSTASRSRPADPDAQRKPTIVDETTIVALRRRGTRHSPPASESDRSRAYQSTAHRSRAGHNSGGSHRDPSPSRVTLDSAPRSTRNHAAPLAIEAPPPRSSTFPQPRPPPDFSVHSLLTSATGRTTGRTTIRPTSVREPEDLQLQQRRERRHSHSSSRASHASRSTKAWEVALPVSASGYTERASEHRSHHRRSSSVSKSNRPDSRHASGSERRSVRGGDAPPAPPKSGFARFPFKFSPPALVNFSLVSRARSPPRSAAPAPVGSVAASSSSSTVRPLTERNLKTATRRAATDCGQGYGREHGGRGGGLNGRKGGTLDDMRTVTPGDSISQVGSETGDRWRRRRRDGASRSGASSARLTAVRVGG